ncbi:MAG: hypothetical protein OEZ06_07235 [Myxococcales bacterium]|nr:hypothetical protein [Myxococcales bacterium]
MPIALAARVFMVSACGDGERTAESFLKARGLPPPKQALALRYTAVDGLRTIVHFVSLELPDDRALVFIERLPCRPDTVGMRRDTPRTPDWFNASDLKAIKYCDTGGPYDGHYHLEITTGRSPAGQTRFLLSFSD